MILVYKFMQKYNFFLIRANIHSFLLVDMHFLLYLCSKIEFVWKVQTRI